MHQFIKNKAIKTSLADRVSVINQYRHDYPSYCVCETRVMVMDECNYLCDQWNLGHMKIQETVSSLIDRKTVAFAKKHNAETTDYDFNDLIKMHNFNALSCVYA